MSCNLNFVDCATEWYDISYCYVVVDVVVFIPIGESSNDKCAVQVGVSSNFEGDKSAVNSAVGVC